MDELNVNQVTPTRDNPLPVDGFSGSEDIFDPATWTSAQAPDSTSPDVVIEPDTIEPVPTTNENPVMPEAPTDSGSAADTSAVPPTTDDMLRFSINYNHEAQDVVMDRADLPGIYQKALVTDKVQQQLAELKAFKESAEVQARIMGYSDAADMLAQAGGAYRQAEIDRRTNNGMDAADAEALYDLRAERARAALNSAPKPAAAPPAAPEQPIIPPVLDGNRDFSAEVEQLMTVRPSLRNSGRGLPPEVQNEVAGGKNLTQAYLEYEARQAQQQAEQLARENAILKQNATSTAKAPVTGVSGGGATNSEPTDPGVQAMLDYWRTH